MTNFYDKDHSLPELVFQGAREAPLEEHVSPPVLAAVDLWRNREVLSDPSPRLLQVEDTRVFTITYEGKVDFYWPDPKSNFVGECLVRDFLFRNGICHVDDLVVRLYAVRYKVIAMIDVEYLVVMPYPTPSDNIGGLAIMCVNQHLAKPIA